MDCPVCLREPSSRLPFRCKTCARNELYELRFKNAETLIQRESIGQQLEEIATRAKSNYIRSPANPQSSTHFPDGGAKLWAMEHSLAVKEQCTQRTREIDLRTQALKSQINEIKAEISSKKATNARRRADVDAAKQNIGERRSAALSSVEKIIKRTDHLWRSVHARTVEDRGFLCHEAAKLIGLKQRKRKKGGVVRADYAVGGVAIYDLRDMNTASPATLSTCYSHVAHLLVLISHYLSLRLPAEITLPHRAYPLPTIFAPSSSYLNREILFPGTTPSHSSSNSPNASRMAETKPHPRPRPLYTHKKLPRLAKEDPATYSLFLEGTTLLAWDVAWVCKTQGLNVGNSWEDVCAIGRNIWELVAGPPSLSPPRRMSNRETPTKQMSDHDMTARPSTPLRRASSHPLLGQLSHGTAYSFLKSVDGTELMKSWKFASHLKVVDKLRAALHGEMKNAEWELLEEKEWDDGGYQFNEDEAVMVRTKPAEGGGNQPSSAMSMITAPFGQNDTVNTDNSEQSRGKGTSGWTKLKPR